jgi:predicted XRE-type DNA-binding protein
MSVVGKTGTGKNRSLGRAGTVAFPSEATLRLMRKKLARAPGSRALPPNADLLDKAKYELCTQFVKFCLDHELTQRQLAARLGANESRVSEIVHYHIDKLTLDRLVRYWEKLEPRSHLKVAKGSS